MTNQELRELGYEDALSGLTPNEAETVADGIAENIGQYEAQFYRAGFSEGYQP